MDETFRVTISRLWFQIFFIFTRIWGRFPIWPIFFNSVETTNQIYSKLHRWLYCRLLLKDKDRSVWDHSLREYKWNEWLIVLVIMKFSWLLCQFSLEMWQLMSESFRFYFSLRPALSTLSKQHKDYRPLCCSLPLNGFWVVGFGYLLKPHLLIPRHSMGMEYQPTNLP